MSKRFVFVGIVFGAALSSAAVIHSQSQPPQRFIPGHHETLTTAPSCHFGFPDCIVGEQFLQIFCDNITDDKYIFMGHYEQRPGNIQVGIRDSFTVVQDGCLDEPIQSESNSAISSRLTTVR